MDLQYKLLRELDDIYVEVLFEGRALKVKREWLKIGPYHGCKTAKDRQRRAAEITNKARKEESQARINAAIVFLRATKQAITVSAISKASGLSRQTIYAHRESFPEVSSTVRK